MINSVNECWVSSELHKCRTATLGLSSTTMHHTTCINYPVFTTAI